MTLRTDLIMKTWFKYRNNEETTFKTWIKTQKIKIPCKTKAWTMVGKITEKPYLIKTLKHFKNINFKVK